MGARDPTPQSVCPGCFTRCEQDAVYCHVCGVELRAPRTKQPRPAAGDRSTAASHSMATLDPRSDERSAQAVRSDERLAGPEATTDRGQTGAPRRRAGGWLAGLVIVGSLIALAIGSADDGAGEGADDTSAGASSSSTTAADAPASDTTSPGSRRTTTTDQRSSGPAMTPTSSSSEREPTCSSTNAAISSTSTSTPAMSMWRLRGSTSTSHRAR
jgi:hypothetical protein